MTTTLSSVTALELADLSAKGENWKAPTCDMNHYYCDFVWADATARSTVNCTYFDGSAFSKRSFTSTEEFDTAHRF